MIFKNLLELEGICQGDCVKADRYRGIFIARISEREAIIATYNNSKPDYLKVPVNEIIPSDKKDGRLIEFAQKHVLWHHKQRKEGKNVFINGKRKNEAKRNSDRKDN